MFRDPLLQQRFSDYMNNLVELAEREVARTRWLPAFHDTAQMYRDRFREARDVYWNRLGGDMAKGLQALSDSGHVELITTAATHGYLPLMEVCPEAAARRFLRESTTTGKYLESLPKVSGSRSAVTHQG